MQRIKEAMERNPDYAEKIRERQRQAQRRWQAKIDRDQQLRAEHLAKKRRYYYIAMTDPERRARKMSATAVGIARSAPMIGSGCSAGGSKHRAKKNNETHDHRADSC
ncbi:hypothetical protein [Alkalilimnicola ehrlichii]|uniref:hypothetical protein n=1 Tax=Alkalilimnicola ehrlichii TaxID=351052 RepID=UPI0011C05FD4|nr:hypothetical protein [Alkalilimnicola ehrlichii]